ncbi:MAG: inorganic pyrophosphatase [Chloroflexi bacterium HGW-Chloroflexi-10]|nr:MAG: inorganic pyrophosphatase [Chloroflexi bacterium HGW-Chloroflexi-10]
MLTESQTPRFWSLLFSLIQNHPIIIDRPQASHHPRYPDLVYPLDYGYLDGTQSMDQGGIDIWRGSQENNVLTGIVCTVDVLKADSEIKILLGCTQPEVETILAFHNDFSQGGIFIAAPTHITNENLEI